jgi:Amt family ammonium transporter
VLSIVGAIAILAVIPAFSILYRGLLDGVEGQGLRASAGLTVVLAAGSMVVWLAVSSVVPGAWASSLELPVAALAAVAGFLASLLVRSATERPLPAILFSLGWTVLVFGPVATVVFFPSSVHLAAGTGPVDLGGALAVSVAVGGGALVILLAGGRQTDVVRPLGRSRARLVPVAGLLLWVGWTVGFLALEGGADAAVSPRILLASIVAPLAGLVGWLLVQRILSATTTLSGAVAGLLAGLVAVSAGAAELSPLWAGVTGLVAGLGCCALVSRMSRHWGGRAWLLVGVHLLAAAIGLAATGLFALGIGFIYDGQPTLLVLQVVSALIVALWSGVVSIGLWFAVRLSRGSVRR